MTAMSPRPRGRAGTTHSEGRAAVPSPGRLTSLRDLMGQMPGADYLMLRIIIFVLIGIGVVMVFSSSMASSLEESGTAWGQAIRQTTMIVAGLITFWAGLKISPRTIRYLVPWLLIVAFALLIAVLTPLGTGREEVGSQSWLMFGPLTLQPSEFARVAIGLFGASVLADKQHRSASMRDPFMVYTVIALLMFALIIAQGDIGMGMSFVLVVAFTLFFAGVNWRVVALIAAGAILGVSFLFLGGGFRSHRFLTYFDALRGNIEDTQGNGFQAYQGFLSLADGGLSGVGLGQSRAKWFYLPEAKNDFIFAIVGEELGLWGGVLVIGLFAFLAYFGMRTAMRAQSQFQSLVAATLTAGVVSQAFFNIGYVVGLLPVTGIQLPMISAGGTAAIITIGSMGLLCNIARHEPEQISAMQSYGRPLFDRLFFIGEPEPVGAAPRGGRRRADRSGAPHDARPEQRAARDWEGGRPVSASRRRGARAAEAARASDGRTKRRQERFGAPVTGRTPTVRSRPAYEQQPPARGRQRGATERGEREGRTRRW